MQQGKAREWFAYLDIRLGAKRNDYYERYA